MCHCLKKRAKHIEMSWLNANTLGYFMRCLCVPHCPTQTWSLSHISFFWDLVILAVVCIEAQLKSQENGRMPECLQDQQRPLRGYGTKVIYSGFNKTVGGEERVKLVKLHTSAFWPKSDLPTCGHTVSSKTFSQTRPVILFPSIIKQL